MLEQEIQQYILNHLNRQDHCLVTSCSTLIHCRGLCKNHFNYWYKYTKGQRHKNPPTFCPLAIPSLEENYIQRLVGFMPESNCWLGGNLNDDGYSRTKVKDKTVSTHRLFYEIFIAPIPEDTDLDHLCRVRNCCNPWHLEPVSHRENILRGENFIAIHAAKTHCINGHEFTKENTKITISSKGHPWRSCKICDRVRSNKAQRSYQARKRLHRE